MLQHILCGNCGSANVCLRVHANTNTGKRTYEAVCCSCRLWTSGKYNTEEELLNACSRQDTSAAVERAVLNIKGYLHDLNQKQLEDLVWTFQQQLNHMHRQAGWKDVK
jgi:hypothetical protein